MVRTATLLVAIGLLACRSAPGAHSGAPAVAPEPALETRAPMPASDPVVQFLLTSAARDFSSHGPHGIQRFRGARVGHLMTTRGEARYLLCGEFLTNDGKWTGFATIQTSDYEQWIGAQAAGFCQDPSVTWDTVEDLSPALQARLEASG